MDRDFDVIILGSGIGGLTCGAFLASSGMRVLVLEKHTRIGGYTHCFKRRQFRFESAVHSIPAGPNGFIMHLLKQLGIDNRIITEEHKTMYHSQWNGFSYSVPVWYDQIIEKLSEDFPHQKSNLMKLFGEMRSFYDAFLGPLWQGSLEETPEYHSFVSAHQNQNFKDYIKSFINDENLQRVIYSQWPFGGTPPSSAPVAFYVLMFIVHAMEGSHSIKGGFDNLASALASVITSNGGEVRTRAEVVSLKAEGGSANSVTLDSGETFSADNFVSNISPYILHNEIIGPESRSRIWLRRLGNLNPSVSCVAVYLGLDTPSFNMVPHNVFNWFDGSDESVYERIQNCDLQTIDHLIFLRPSDSEDDKTLTILNFVKKSASDNWKSEKILHAERIMTKAESIIPGLRGHVSLMETGSPSTFERYTGNTGGALYGFENTSHIYGEAKLPIKTHLSNLFQTGHWGKPGGGIWNTMYNGYTTALTMLTSIENRTAIKSAKSS
ncbi:MAG: NAD(P)/FAD-dependent oxidoreductase [Fibrobacter sp.]|nr:NAD(P)/FAD-dependent oxidoreductase [Fibrobacter sp.]